MKPENEAANWYWEIVVDCHSDLVDVFTYHLFEIGMGGTEEIASGEGIVQLKLFFEGGFVSPAAMIAKIKKLMEVPDQQIVILNAEKKKVENWQANWKKHFKPLAIGNCFMVLPPWERKHKDKHNIIIQPGFGFGTGYHESTNLALQLLEWLHSRQKLTTVLDVGTGSGILSIASLHLGATKVEAIDIDPEAVAEVSNNMALSGFKSEMCRTTVTDPADFQRKPYDVVIANIEDHILSKMAEDLIRLTNDQGWLLLSGILTERKQLMLDSFKKVNIVKELNLNEWTGIILQKEQEKDLMKPIAKSGILVFCHFLVCSY